MNTNRLAVAKSFATVAELATATDAQLVESHTAISEWNRLNGYAEYRTLAETLLADEIVRRGL